MRDVSAHPFVVVSFECFAPRRRTSRFIGWMERFSVECGSPLLDLGGWKKSMVSYKYGMDQKIQKLVYYSMGNAWGINIIFNLYQLFGVNRRVPGF